MTENKRRFKVEIGGKEYIIIGEASTARMNAVVGVVNQQLAAFKEQMPGISDERAAILTAVNAVADQLALQQKEKE